MLVNCGLAWVLMCTSYGAGHAAQMLLQSFCAERRCMAGHAPHVPLCQVSSARRSMAPSKPPCAAVCICCLQVTHLTS